LKKNVTVLLLLLGAGLNFTHAWADDSLPYFRKVLPFTLTDQDGQHFKNSDLLGQVWVADFIFTRCASSCPMMTAEMARIQRATEGTVGVRMVSFTVDPDHDSPVVLADYAKRAGAKKEKWVFLTGPKKRLYPIIKDNFYMALATNPNASPSGGDAVDHSTRFALVDKFGQIRGYYDYDNPAMLKALRHDINYLLGRKEDSLAFLPHLNGALNVLSFLLLALGYLFIKTGHRAAHKACMLSACGASLLFLVSYVAYHADHGVTRFQGEGAVRTAYFWILGSHTILAVAIIPLIVTVVRRGLRGDFARHKPLARFTLPLWLYVSVTGFTVYWILYHLYPGF